MYQVEKDEVGIKASDGLSQRWRGVPCKYISSERLCAALDGSSISGQPQTVHQYHQVLPLQVFTRAAGQS